MGLGTMGRHLWKWHSIRSFRYILQRQFATTTTAEGPISTSPDSISPLADFLVASLGFSEKQALSTSTKLTTFRQSRGATKVSATNFLRNADLVISFLRQKGLDKPQIRNVVFSVPRILTSKIEQNLEPKITFFEEVCISVSDIAHVISTPGILDHRLDTTIRPAFKALREILGSDDNVVRIIKGLKLNTLPLVTKHLVCNVSSLRAKGIPIESIRRRILVQPSPFFRQPEVFKDIMAEAEEKWGVPTSSFQFLLAVHVLGCLNEKNIDSKCRMFESFGWDRSDIVNLFRQNPICWTSSEGRIKAMLSFFMNELGYDPGYIVAHSTLVNYSMEKRVLPRHLVFQLLKEKGLIRENFSLYTAIKMTESRFLKRFIQPFKNDLPNLYDIYVNSISFSAERQIKRRKNTYFTRMRLKPKPDTAR